MKYDLIYADPPWEYDNKQMNDPARGGITYPVLSMKDLYDLPVHHIAADNSILVMWVTCPKLMDEKYNPLEIIRNWGFKPVTVLFAWIKENKSGGLYSGMGYYTNSNIELAIVAKRGKGLERQAKNVKQIIQAPIGKHSEKPVETYQRLEALYGDVERIELFARSKREGWHATGLDLDGVDIREFLHGNISGNK